MLPENRNYWIRGEDGQEYGPAELDDLREWVQENRAGLGTSVRTDEPGAHWEPWQEYPELVALLAEASVTGPPPIPAAAYVAAPLARRFFAAIFDLILISFLVSPITYVMMTYMQVTDWQAQIIHIAFHPEEQIPPEIEKFLILSNLITFATVTLYMAWFHAMHGQTPAKAILHLRVIDQTGRKPALFKAFVRGLALCISLCIAIYLYFIPLFFVFFVPQRRAFHDLVAGTCVVKA